MDGFAIENVRDIVELEFASRMERWTGRHLEGCNKQSNLFSKTTVQPLIQAAPNTTT